MKRSVSWSGIWTVVLLMSIGQRAAYAGEGAIAGTVVDALGARIAGARVTLLRDGRPVRDTSTDALGEFVLGELVEGRYQIEVTATGFETRVTEPLLAVGASRARIEVRLQVGPIAEQVAVTAAAAELPLSQTGAAVTMLDAQTLGTLGHLDVLETMRTVPGAQVVQTGGRGGGTSLFVRGGNSNFNKILVDGLPVNDIGGAFDFADVATTGVESVEVFRGSNSVLFGSDALTGVVNITTRRGRSRIPEGTVLVDGGNLGTSHEELSLGGVVRRVDYFATGSHMRTDNSVPNNGYHNNTFAGRFGLALGAGTTLSGTVRRTATEWGSPNAFDFFGVADDSRQTRDFTYASVVARSQITDHWQTTLRFGVADQQYRSANPAPSGEPFDPFGFGANYLGKTVTVRGGNGYKATGRAILDFGGAYPSVFDASVTRRTFSGESDYHVWQWLDVAGGARVEAERGSAVTGSFTETHRNNYGGFGEARAVVTDHLFVAAGIGIDHNAIFGTEATPRISVAGYLRRPSRTFVADTKVTFNGGSGIKEPSLFQELSSLFALIPFATAERLGVSPIDAERSRSVDVGVEQGLWGGRARIRGAFFHNRFSDLIEFVDRSVLPRLGVPVEAAGATAFGAYVNSQSYRARGLELSGEARVRSVKVAGTYTYLDAIVGQSFSSDALAPAVNPLFPDVAIGAFTPLVGGRPFRRPTNSGSVVASYDDRRLQAAVAAFFAGKQDDSTFLTDAFFGNSLLLPNKDLDAAYQKVDISVGYRVHPRLRWYVIVENAFNESFEAAAGYPALPRTFRTGALITLGGDSR
jgi:iron complex outermembrane receptor protein/vitamin B12 transporter